MSHKTTGQRGFSNYELKQTYYYHPDHLESSNYITDHEGEVYEHIEYMPYGETWIDEVSNKNIIDYKFTGKELDTETGLYYFGARYLDPQLSRWISTDPALGDYMPEAPVDKEAKERNEDLPGNGGVFNPVNLAVYHYSSNNPVKYIDPDGFKTIYYPKERDDNQQNDYYKFSDLGFGVYESEDGGIYLSDAAASKGKGQVYILDKRTGKKHDSTLDLNILDGEIGDKKTATTFKLQLSLGADLLTVLGAQGAETLGGALSSVLPTDPVSITNTGLGIRESMTSDASKGEKAFEAILSPAPFRGTKDLIEESLYYEEPLETFLEIKDVGN